MVEQLKCRFGKPSFGSNSLETPVPLPQIDQIKTDLERSARTAVIGVTEYSIPSQAQPSTRANFEYPLYAEKDFLVAVILLGEVKKTTASDRFNARVTEQGNVIDQGTIEVVDVVELNK